MEEQNRKAALNAGGDGQLGANLTSSIISQNGLSAKVFLETLFGEKPAGQLLIWTKQHKKSYWPTSITEAVSQSLELSKDKDVYFGLGLREKPLGEYSRGEEHEVIAIPGFWIDIDIKHPAHGIDNLPTKEQVDEILEDVPIKLSMLIHSGYGLHGYCPFDTLLEIKGQAERELAKEWSVRFQRLFKKKAEDMGLYIDSTADLPRVLRVPGTLNHKRETPERVKVVKPLSVRYKFHEMQAAIIAAEKELGIVEGAQGKRKSNASATGNYPSSKAEKIIQKCNFLQHCRDDAETLSEPEWKKMVHILAYAEGGADLIHELSSIDAKRYKAGETDQKIKQAIESEIPPYTCGTIQAEHGKHCEGCPHFVEDRSPYSLGIETKEEKVAAALEIGKAALDKAKSGDIGAPFEQEVMGALALLQKKKPDDFIRFKDEFKKAGVPLRDFNKALKRANSQLRLVKPGEDIPADSHLADWFTDEFGQLFKRKLTEHGYQLSLITRTAPKIQQSLISEQSGHEYWEIVFKNLRGKSISVTLPRDVIATKRGIVAELSKYGFDIGEDNAKDIGKYLRDYAAAYAKQTEEQKVTERFGWCNNNQSFVIGKDLIGQPGIEFKAPGPGEQQLADAFTIRGSLDGWKKIIPLVKDKPWVMFKIYQSFLPPLLPILEIKGHTLSNYGESSKGKTLTDMIAASIWGNANYKGVNPSLMVQGAGITLDKMEKTLALMTNIPVFLQDAHKIKDHIITATLHDIELGMAKGRGMNTNGSQANRRIETILYATSESPITAASKDGGIVARLIECGGSPIREENSLLVYEIEKVIYENYGHAGRAFIQYLLDNMGKWDEWRLAFHEMKKEAAQSTEGLDTKVTRTNPFYVAVMMAGKLADQALGLFLGEGKIEADIGACIEEARGATDTRPYYEKALDVLRDWIPANRHDFYVAGEGDLTHSRDIPGVWHEKEKFVAMFSTHVEAVLDRNGYQLARCVREWREKGCLNLDRDGKTQKPTYLPYAKASRRMYQFTFEALELD